MAAKVGKLFQNNPIVENIFKVLYHIRNSFLKFIFSIGLMIEVTSILLLKGPEAGILGILGVSAMIYALGGFILLRLIRY